MRKALVVVVAWAIAAVAIAGWVTAQSLDDRIERVNQTTAALFHTLATSSFAVIFALSAVLQAIVVTARFRDEPASYRARRLLLSQLMLLALAAGWLICIVIGQQAIQVEMVLGVAVAVASIIAMVHVAARDPESALRARARRERARSARSPRAQTWITRARLIVPAGLAVIVAGACLLAAVIPVEHHRCELTGMGNLNGAQYLVTTCGDIAVDGGHSPGGSAQDLFYSGHRADITTQGFGVVGLRLLPVAIELTISDP